MVPLDDELDDRGRPLGVRRPTFWSLPSRLLPRLLHALRRLLRGAV